MQAVYQWFPGFGTKPPALLPHEHNEMACSKQRPSLNLAAPYLMKRARSATLMSSSANSTQSSPSKRRKIESEPCPEEPAVPAAQEQPVASDSSPRAPFASGANVKPGGSELAHSVGPSVSNSVSDGSYRFNDPLLASDNRMDTHKRQRVQDKLRSQFDLEILLKHDELRLVEQELAKVHIALEQLRRCRQIPFPGDLYSPVTLEQTLDGTGPAVMSINGIPQPAHFTPYGVAEGPYSRHYSKWLLPHPNFDSEPSHLPRQLPVGLSSTPSVLRSGNDTSAPHRRQRNSTGGMIQASAVDQQPPPKEKAPHGPQVLRRPDGQLVKLKCKDCGKEDVSSVQGFLNHCRIAHQNDMKSHAEAANTCGVPVEAASELVHVPAPSEPINTSSSTQRAHAQIHPLITSLSLVSTTPYLETDATAPRPSEDPQRQTLPINPSSANPAIPMNLLDSSVPLISDAHLPAHDQGDSTFIPSTIAPSLSALAQRSGIGRSIDLQQLFTSAKEKIDLDRVEPLYPDSDGEDEPKLPSGAFKKSQQHADDVASSVSAPKARALASGVRMPTKPPSIEVPSQSRHSCALSNSQSSVDAGWPSSSPQAPPHTNTLSPYAIVSHGDIHMADLSPRTNPPGLVTDHEDDEEDMEDEVKSVIEHPSANQTNVRIYGDHGDLEMASVGNDSKDVVAQWDPVRSNEHSGQSVSISPIRKKRRGRPKKGKANMRK